MPLLDSNNGEMTGNEGERIMWNETKKNLKLCCLKQYHHTAVSSEAMI